MSQNFSNHKKYVPGYHYVLLPALLVLLIGSFVNLAHSDGSNFYSASLICFLSVILIIIAFYARMFPLGTQNRVIRAEENLRHYILTGKALPSGLRMSQIIALRFASDEEFPALVSRAQSENLSSTDIKKAIQNWRADHYRI
ncbi:MAG: DUF6526 family protein [Bacteroidota bacterium]|jgi:hypothetical protein